MTIHHLLTHTSGLGSFWKQLNATNWAEIDLHETAVDELAGVVLVEVDEIPPGEGSSGFCRFRHDAPRLSRLGTPRPTPSPRSKRWGSATTPNTAANATHFNADQALAGNPPPYNAGSAGVFHGTSVAGIAAARTNNALGVAGVGGGCQVMPVRLGGIPSSNRVAAGVNWAANNGARVVSMSLTTTATAAANNAMTNAWGAGLVLCAATGNSGGNTTSPAVGFPASHAKRHRGRCIRPERPT